MTLTPAQRRLIWAYIMSQGLAPGGVTTKADLRAAVDAMDEWIEANQASFNDALPQPYKGEATAQQKVELFALVLRVRTGRQI